MKAKELCIRYSYLRYCKQFRVSVRKQHFHGRPILQFFFYIFIRSGTNVLKDLLFFIYCVHTQIITYDLFNLKDGLDKRVVRLSFFMQQTNLI